MKLPYDYALMIHSKMEKMLRYDPNEERWYLPKIGVDDKVISKAEILNMIYRMRTEMVKMLEEDFTDKPYSIKLCKNFIAKKKDLDQMKRNAFINNIYKHLCQIRALSKKQQEAYIISWSELEDLIK
jgi:hypothetical protein